MGERYLTMAEIETLYPNEWVLIDRFTKDRKTGNVAGGYVVMHTTDRAEFDHRLIDRDEFPHVVTCAIFHIGKPESDEALSPTT